MVSTIFLVAAAALSIGCYAVPDPAGTTCPPVHSGTTTTTVKGPGRTSTSYSAIAAVGADIDCHGYSLLEIKTRGPSPTTTVTATGTLFTSIPICAATMYPSGCPSSCPTLHAGTTTLTIDGPGRTSTKYAHTFGDGVFTDCHGYTHITTKQKGPKPTKTVSRKGTVTTAVYMCNPTSVPPGC